MVVNFADKIVVGLAGVPIMTDLKLQPEQFGLLGSSFFFLYSLAAIVVGFIVNRVETRWVLLVLAAIWALAQFPDGGHDRFQHAADLPRLSSAPARDRPELWRFMRSTNGFPDEKRTLPTAILIAGIGVRRHPRGSNAELGNRQL